LKLSFGILELNPSERRNPLKFLIIKNVSLGVLLGRSPPYPDSESVVDRVKGDNERRDLPGYRGD
jgi:hypothetical protein